MSPIYVSDSGSGGSPVMSFPTYRNVTLRTSDAVYGVNACADTTVPWE